MQYGTTQFNQVPSHTCGSWELLKSNNYLNIPTFNLLLKINAANLRVFMKKFKEKEGKVCLNFV